MYLDLRHLTKIAVKDLKSLKEELNKLVDHLEKKIQARQSKDDKVKRAIKCLKTFWEETIDAIHLEGEDITQLSKLYDTLQAASQSFSILEVADEQRIENRNSKHFLEQISQLDKLIQSCYQPILDAPSSLPLRIDPTAILGVFFEGRAFARPNFPTPYINLPPIFASFFWSWIGIAHEVAHQIYSQTRMLQDELDIIVTRALRNYPVRIQRLWFHWLPEVFADIYGIMLMGEAFLHAQQPLLVCIDATHNRLRPEALIDSLLKGRGTTHPAAIIRGHLGLYAYECLLEDIGEELSADNPLKRWDIEIFQPLECEPIPDPHEPLYHCLEKSSYVFDGEEAKRVMDGMESVVKTILREPLRSFNCRSLKDLVDFSRDQQIRDELIAVIKEGKEPIKNVEDAYDSLKRSFPKLKEESVMRYWIAVQRLFQFEGL